MSRKKKNPKLKSKQEDYLKANRKGAREAEIENATGWNAKHKVHKSKNNYTRKEKHKISPSFFYIQKFANAC